MSARTSCALAAAVVGAGVFGASGVAYATPRPLPFTYQYDTLPEGEMEIEQFADFVPTKALSSTSGAPVWFAATQFTTELEYGITDRLELGLYFTLAPRPGEQYLGASSLTDGNGLKQRLRLRLAEEGEWPLDIGFYGEIVENDHEIELEAKILLQRRIGRLRAMVNLWAEREFYYENKRDWVLNPTAGLTYEVTPAFHPGLEYWMRVEFPDPAPHPRPFNLGPHHMVGPTALVNFGKIWWSTGVYLRADDFGRSTQPGDMFGPVWVRTIVGFGI